MSARTLPAAGRRGLLGGAAALLSGAATATVPPSSDAPLLAICAEFQRLHAALNDHIANVGDDYGDDRVFDSIWEGRRDAADAIKNIPARTPAGHVAKARVAVALLEEAPIVDKDVYFAYSMLYDLAELD